MKKNILVYGGTNLPKPLSSFVEELCYYLLKPRDIALRTGGFYNKTEEKISTDVAALNAAKRYAKENNLKTEDVIEAWLPDPTKDRIREGVKRFGKDSGASIKVLYGSTPQVRRLKMVKDVDAVITISGKKYTQLVLDLSFAIGKPTYPIPLGKKDSTSQLAWKENEEEIIKSFDLKSDFLNEMKETDIAIWSADDKVNFAKKIAAQIHTKMERRCLILMQFNETEPDNFYDEVIKPAVEEAGYIPIRLDKETNEGDIFRTFLQRLKECDAILADITDANPNVMYELGHAHALGYSSTLLCRKTLDPQILKGVPFYLKSHTIQDADTFEEKGKKDLIKRIVNHLENKRKNSGKQGNISSGSFI